MIAALLWVSFAAWIAIPWFEDLHRAFGFFGAIFILGGLAFLPGFFSAFLFFSLATEQREKLVPPKSWPPLAVLIAAYNEEEKLGGTLRALSLAGYPGSMRIVIVDDGSDDRTLQKARSLARASRMDVDVLSSDHKGKAAALNRGLETTTEEFVLVLDSDTEVLPGSLSRLVARMLQSPSDVGAVAGSLLVSGGNWLAALQSWDYELAIAAIKRSQATMSATLVAQGAFSLSRRSFLLGVDPWRDASGEDIILSWQMLRRGSIVFEPSAFASTHPPQDLVHFWRQRVRWARGMIEGIRDSGKGLLRNRAGTRHGVLVDMLFPWVDAAYTFAFLPGIIMFLLGNPLIVGVWTLFLLPLQLLLFSLGRWKQRQSLQEAGVSHRPRRLAFWGFLFFYQLLLSPASLWGYATELLGRRRRWK